MKHALVYINNEILPYMGMGLLLLLVVTLAAAIVLMCLAISWGHLSADYVPQHQSEYQIVGTGKLDNFTDCMGLNTVRIGDYATSPDTYIYALNPYSLKASHIPINRLKGGDCEYMVYKGSWIFPITEFYYITPK